MTSSWLQCFFKENQISRKRNMENKNQLKSTLQIHEL